MSSGLPDIVTVPDNEYLTKFGLVEIDKLKVNETWLVSFFCSSIFAFMSKNNSSVEAICTVRSACKLLRCIETVTPETEYCGFTIDSSLLHLGYFLFNFCIRLLLSTHNGTDWFWC